MRVLVTGSRDYANRPALNSALHAQAVIAARRGEPLTVVHGGASGADRLAGDWATNAERAGWRVTQEVHPARWSECSFDCDEHHRQTNRAGAEYCPQAGTNRNAEMVGLGADVCLAFVMPCAKPRCRRTEPHWSHGADDCATRAEAAGVPTVRIGADGREVAR